MTNIETLHKISLGMIREQDIAPQYANIVGFVSFIMEFRTITLGVPRQCGKTKYLLELKKKISSLMFVYNRLTAEYCYKMDPGGSRSNIVSFDNMDSIQRQLRGFKSMGLKYSVFLIDEYSFMKEDQVRDFKLLLSELKSNDMLSEDFYVLRLGTPVI